MRERRSPWLCVGAGAGKQCHPESNPIPTRRISTSISIRRIPSGEPSQVRRAEVRNGRRARGRSGAIKGSPGARTNCSTDPATLASGLAGLKRCHARMLTGWLRAGSLPPTSVRLGTLARDDPGPPAGKPAIGRRDACCARRYAAGAGIGTRRSRLRSSSIESQGRDA